MHLAFTGRHFWNLLEIQHRKQIQNVSAGGKRVSVISFLPEREFSGYKTGSPEPFLCCCSILTDEIFHTPISHGFGRELFFIFQIIIMNLLYHLHLTQPHKFNLICKQVDFMAWIIRLLTKRIVRPKLFGKCSRSYLFIIHVVVIKAQIDLIPIHRVENIIRNFHSADLCRILLADSIQALLLGRFNPGTFCIITFLITMHIMNPRGCSGTWRASSNWHDFRGLRHSWGIGIELEAVDLAGTGSGWYATETASSAKNLINGNTWGCRSGSFSAWATGCARSCKDISFVSSSSRTSSKRFYRTASASSSTKGLGSWTVGT